MFNHDMKISHGFLWLVIATTINNTNGYCYQLRSLMLNTDGLWLRMMVDMHFPGSNNGKFMLD